MRLARFVHVLIAFVIVICVCVTLAVAQVVDRSPQLDLPRVAVTVTTQTGDHTFDAQVADTPQTRSKGLMFRRDMPPREGMLFIFEQEQPLSFWMENTPLPLDLIFIRDDGSVRHVAKNAVPYSRASIPSRGSARFVLEVNAGVADEIGLKQGDLIAFPRP